METQFEIILAINEEETLKRLQSGQQPMVTFFQVCGPDGAHVPEMWIEMFEETKKEYPRLDCEIVFENHLVSVQRSPAQLQETAEFLKECMRVTNERFHTYFQNEADKKENARDEMAKKIVATIKELASLQAIFERVACKVNFTPPINIATIGKLISHFRPEGKPLSRRD